MSGWPSSVRSSVRSSIEAVFWVGWQEFQRQTVPLSALTEAPPRLIRVPVCEPALALIATAVPIRDLPIYVAEFHLADEGPYLLRHRVHYELRGRPPKGRRWCCANGMLWMERITARPSSNRSVAVERDDA